MTKYKIMIADRNYSSWYLTYPDDSKQLDLDQNLLQHIQPITHKLFTKDVIQINENNHVELVYSPLRTQNMIAGVLLLENNKTFGRNETKKRLLYKCIPDDKHLPSFLVPYELKMGFSKSIKNKYITFKYDNWRDKHPHGMIVEVLGDVDNMDVFCEYQLYCKSLHVSMTDFNNKMRELLKKHSCDEYISQIVQNPKYKLTIPKNQHIFTIDPPTSTDFDDALSIHKCEGENKYKICIYIANVYFWLETLGLWKSFSKRVSTIYLPDRKRPMLPTILSDTLCSLQENQQRFALTMELIVDASDWSINSVKMYNSLICVSKNYVYQDPRLLDDVHYNMLEYVTSHLDKNIHDSHDVVAFWMITYNRLCGEKMAQSKVGIFRAMSYIKDIDEDIPQHLECETRRVISSWNNTVGQYTLLDNNVDIKHDMMKLSSYIHITSPIRRLVDLLNQMIYMNHFEIISSLSSQATEFLGDWIGQMDYINISMRSIRKVQNECEMLRKCSQNQDLITQHHNGIVFDKVSKNDGMHSYMVYLKQIGLLFRINTQQSLTNYQEYTFNIFIFEDEHHIKKKIKLGLVMSGSNICYS
jgi:exoribonuclease R